MKKSLKHTALALLLAVTVGGLGGYAMTTAPTAPLTVTANAHTDTTSDLNVTPLSATLTLDNVADFLTFAQNCTHYADYSLGLTVELTADLDFAGVNFTPISNFAGTFNGNGHTLTNLTVTDAQPMTAVFATVTDQATIADLTVTNLHLAGDNYVGFVGKNYGTLRNLTVSGTVKGENYVGGIVAYNGRSSETDEDDPDDDTIKLPIKVLSYASTSDCQNYATVTGQTQVGGIAGENVGNLNGCTNHGTINGKKPHSTSTVASVGGIAGNNTYRVVDCTNHGTVTGGDDSTAVGGICGLATGEVYYAMNYGTVTGTHYVGGVVGLYGDLSTDGDDADNDTPLDTTTHQMFYLANYANVTAVDHAGGIVGSALNLTLTLTNAASTGDVTVTAGNYAGGIIGYTTNTQITSCTTSGTITAKGLNAGRYVGGIAGYANHVVACASIATLKGTDYLGGLVGYASDSVRSCYTNTLLIPTADSLYVGLIAGKTQAFNASLNTFGDRVQNNYYLGNGYGIQGTAYGSHFHDAAAPLTSDELVHADTLSPSLSADFAGEYWQAPSTAAYPVLRYFRTVATNDQFDDTTTWAALFTKYQADFAAITNDHARVTYTVVFREWRQDNGDLTDDDGVIQYDNFDLIHTVRVAANTPVTCPALTYATADHNGVYTYQGAQARYYVNFPADFTVTTNTLINAEYTVLVTTVANDNQTLLVTGEFATGTTVELVKVGDYYDLHFTRDGATVTVTNAVIKIKPDAKQNVVAVLNGDQEQIVTTTRSGNYLAFTYNGNPFRLTTASRRTLPIWAWVLIGVGSAAVVSGGVLAVIFNKHHPRGKVTPPTVTAPATANPTVESNPTKKTTKITKKPVNQ